MLCGGCAHACSRTSSTYLVIVHLGLDEAALKVGVDRARRLGRHPPVADRPASALIGPRCVVVDQLQGVVALPMERTRGAHERTTSAAYERSTRNGAAENGLAAPRTRGRSFGAARDDKYCLILGRG
jgi:hypothetical protein